MSAPPGRPPCNVAQLMCLCLRSPSAKVSCSISGVIAGGSFTSVMVMVTVTSPAVMVSAVALPGVCRRGPDHGSRWPFTSHVFGACYHPSSKSSASLVIIWPVAQSMSKSESAVARHRSACRSVCRRLRPRPQPGRRWPNLLGCSPLPSPLWHWAGRRPMSGSWSAANFGGFVIAPESLHRIGRRPHGGLALTLCPSV